MHANRPVRIDELSHVVSDDVGPDAIQRVRALVRRLASALPTGTLVRDLATARLTVPDDSIDAVRFTALATAARRHLREGEHDLVAADVDVAISLWRSDPYPELAARVSATPEIERLRRVRVGVLEMQQEVSMHGGVDFTTVADLRDLVDTHPDRLGLRLLLARALHLMDRQADALGVLRQTASDFGGHPASRRLTDLIAHRDLRVASLSIIDVDDEPLH
ncbi:AfsR/SARP family transcriptional regulator [Occultella gossypii]|uniref:Bacterial transcriptional activator domain-containing protein n=1 Tax=Occultella gossypii TaxID=2800820 RepID=A0ABS7S3C5_9MICO|nr:BTAD domain-containing putative transcriptional regulator [Occultella gossypii]MBZ2194797.1 hypothetical protein [Occultella gossypii]